MFKIICINSLHKRTEFKYLFKKNNIYKSKEMENII